MAMVGRMAGERERAYALLGEAKMQNDSTAKTENLKQLLEILLNREPGLIAEFVPHLMDFQADPSSPVLKYLAEIIEEIGLKSSDQVPFMVPVLMALLRDNTPAVARRAISTGTNLFRNTLEQVALQGIYTGQVDLRLQEAWAWMTRFKDAVYPAAYHHGNDGVRLQAIKFVETTILLFTPDSNGLARPPPQQEYANGTARGFNIAWIAGGHPVLDPGAMGQEASKNVGSLLNQLRPFESSALPGPVAIVLVNSLAAVAKRRPSLYGRVLPVLLGLAPGCENIKGGQVASVVHALKNAFISLLKCQHSGAGPWRDRLVGALRSMNAGDVADSTMRSIDRALRNADRERVSRDPRAVKDERVQPAGQVVDVARKRPVMQENGNQLGESESSNGKRLRVTQHSGAVLNMQPNVPNSAMDTVPPPTPAVPMDTGLTPIQQMISMIGALVAQGERAAASVELLITNIAADMLADIVIANMTHLPHSPPPVEEASPGGENGPVGGVVSVLPPTPLPAAPIAMAPVLAPPQVPALAPVYVSPPVVVAPPLAPPPVVVPPVLVPPVMPAVVSPVVIPPAAEVHNPQILAEGRRDPRRQDPRRLDPRRSSAPGVSPTAKEEDTTMSGSPLPEIETIIHPVEVKREPLAPVGRDPLSVAPVVPSQVPFVAPLLAQVKSEPVEEKTSPAGARTGSPPVVPVAPLSPPVAAVSVPSSPMQSVPLVAPVKAEPSGAAAVSPPLSVPAPAPTVSKEGRAGPSFPSSGIAGGMGSAGIPVNVPVPTLPVISLTEEQQVGLGKGALIRILEGHKTISAAGGDGLRITLLARLVAQSCEDEQALEVVRKHILADYQNHKGHELALHILYQLYAEQASEEGTLSTSTSPISLAYDKLLLSLAQGLRETLPPSDKALSRLLAEVPVLPMAALDLLQGLCNPAAASKDGKEPPAGDRITQGLSALWSLILQRPPARETCLKMALQCAIHEVDDIRAKAIRLVANKLYPLSYVAEGIESFALEMLQSVVEARQAPVEGAGKEPMDVDEGEPTSVPAKKEADEHEQSSNGDQRVVQGPDEVSLNNGGGRSVPRTNSGSVSMTEAQRCMSLFFALCTKKHSLLRQLFSVYGHVSKTVKQAVHRHIPILFRTIGSSSPELLQLISDPPAGSEHLLLQVLHSLTEGSTPSPELISTVKKLYETKLQDAVFLIPVLSSLTKDEVLPIFPRLVDLPPEKFQTALARILQGSAHTGPALTPTEVLIALHGIDPSRDSVPLKKVMDACSACLQQRTVFTQQVLAKVLNQLVEQTPLPLLFMRTVIQAVGAFPTLVSFVMEILSRLVNKQIWKFPKLWIGFLKCANQTVPHSFHVLLQLPLVQLEDAFMKHPNLKVPLASHASQPNIRSTVPRSSLVLLGLAAQDESNATPPQSLPESSAVEMQVKH